METKLIRFCEVKAGDIIVISYDVYWGTEDITFLVVKTEMTGISLILHGFVVGFHQLVIQAVSFSSMCEKVC
jgi:hypothetical protein